MTRASVAACAFVLLYGIPWAPCAGRAYAQSSPARTPSTRALAQTLTGQARADYDAGKTLASDGDFAGALIKFTGAYDQSNDVRLLWNVAFCEKNLRHYSKVITTLRRYLAEGAGTLTDKDRKDAQDLVEVLQPFTTNATFLVSEDGAQILVDESLVGVSPLHAPVVLDIGERRLRVVKEGFRPYERTLPVGGSATVNIDVKLEKELHEGHLIVSAPPNATIALDEKSMGVGKIDVAVASGGHELRVTAPGMRPFQTEVVIQDREARSFDIILDKLPEPEKPKIRASIGCAISEPRGPEDGLVLYLDGPDVLPPVNVKRKWSDQLGRNVVEYVEYAASAGRHTLRARIPECNSIDTEVFVAPGTGVDVTGALPSDAPVPFKGPQGAPGLWRIGLDLWMLSPSSFQVHQMPETYEGALGAATGLALGGGLVTRWFGAFVQTAWGAGSMSRASFTTNYALPSAADVTAYATTLRLAFRLPLNVIAFNVGPEVGGLELDVKGVETGRIEATYGGWAALDAQPLCDWGGRILADAWGYSDRANGGGGPAATLQIGLFYEPNPRCRHEQATKVGLRTGAQ
jgi:hypothetical protein